MVDKLLPIVPTAKFKKDLKKISKQQKDRNLLDTIINKLQKKEKLPIKNRDHSLSGNWDGYRECHINPDWLLIYRIKAGDVELLELVRTGSHSELFK